MWPVDANDDFVLTCELHGYPECHVGIDELGYCSHGTARPVRVWGGKQPAGERSNERGFLSLYNVKPSR